MQVSCRMRRRNTRRRLRSQHLRKIAPCPWRMTFPLTGPPTSMDGELRRYVLDQLRRGNIESCEVFLRQMDDIYALLTTVDFPDAITGGLRRTTDAARGILEKTRGDLTIAVGQAQLQHVMLALQQALQNV